MSIDKRDMPMHGFSVDVEDYFQVSAFEGVVARERWDEYPRRVEANTERILTLLDSYGVRGTFFVLGWIAERHPQLVRRIARAGHEIASHGYEHRLIYTQTPAEFRADIRRASAVLESVTGRAVNAYRAPSFSITPRSRWALAILREEGITLDSSVMPVRHDLYGMPGAKVGLHRLPVGDDMIWEFPPAVASFGRLRLPVGSGGYLRLLPFWFTLWCLRRLQRKGPFVLYIHPWEVDPAQPRLPARLRSRFRHYTNLHATYGRLDRMLREFRFGPVGEIVAEHARRSEATWPLRQEMEPCPTS
jgi:polysaccharide deacetylase family protein (PEP-CTERM system associated)